MLVIKKYKNRRLYNSSASEYCSLSSLGEFIRSGIDFVVLDHAGQDITRQVLAQIILEQEVSGNSMLSATLLRQLIRLSGSDVQSSLPEFLNHAALLLQSLRSATLNAEVTGSIPALDSDAIMPSNG